MNQIKQLVASQAEYVLYKFEDNVILTNDEDEYISEQWNEIIEAQQQQRQYRFVEHFLDWVRERQLHATQSPGMAIGKDGRAPEADSHKTRNGGNTGESTSRSPKRGRPKGSGDTDRKFDKRCWNRWEGKRFPKYADAAREMDCTEKEFKRAIDRERKRRTSAGNK